MQPKKSHTCEEVGHTSEFLFGVCSQKNHTHVKRWGTPQNFCLGFTDGLEKQLFIKQTVKVGQ